MGILNIGLETRCASNGSLPSLSVFIFLSGHFEALESEWKQHKTSMHERESREWKRNEKKSKYFLVFCFSQWSNVASIASPCANDFSRREEKILSWYFTTPQWRVNNTQKSVLINCKNKNIYFLGEIPLLKWRIIVLCTQRVKRVQLEINISGVLSGRRHGRR